jgi:hypothetical protein
MKKIICALMVIALLFTLGACKKDSDNNPTAGETTTVAEQTEETTEGPIALSVDELKAALGDAGANWDGNIATLTEDMKLAVQEYFTNAGTPVEFRDDGVYYTAPTDVTTMPGGTVTVVETQADGKPVDSQFDSAVGNLLKSEKYTMSFSIQMKSDKKVETLPVTAYVSGKKLALKTSMAMELKKLEVMMITNGTDFTVVIPSLKAYAKLPADGFDDLFPSLVNSDDANVKYLGTTKVTSKGVEYICETYKSDDGSVTKYYFNSGKLKRIEITDKDGTPTVFENVNFTATVDESVFTVPKGYADMSALLGNAF